MGLGGIKALKKFIFIIAVFIVLGGIVAFAYLRPKHSQNPGPGGAFGRGPQEALVETQPVSADNISKIITVTGTINARADIEVYPKQSGEIVKLLVDVGDKVKAGQVLANIDSKTYELQLKQAEADLASAKASYDKNSSLAYINTETSFKQAKSNLDRLLSVLKQSEIDLQLQAKQAEAAIQKSTSDLKIAQARLDAAISGAREQEKEQAKVRVENAKRNLERLKALQKDDMVSQDQVEAAQLQYDIYNAQLSLLEEGTRPEDIEVLKAQVDAAKTSLESAKDNMMLIDIKKANLEAAKAQLDSAQASFEQASAAKDASVWEKELNQAEASMKRALASLELAQQRLDESAIKAPINGTIAQRFLDKGDMASTNRPLVSIVDLEIMKVTAKVPERDIGSIKLGQRAFVKPDAYPGQVFNGTVTNISPIIDRTSQTCDIEIEVPNPDQKLKSGMFARIDLTVSENKFAPVIPTDAIIKEGNESFVYIAENGKAIRKVIETGISDGIRTEIISGIQVGDQLIIAGQSNLKDEMPIKLIGAKDKNDKMDRKERDMKGKEPRR